MIQVQVEFLLEPGRASELFEVDCLPRIGECLHDNDTIYEVVFISHPMQTDKPVIMRVK